MILSFITQLNGKPTYFLEKIWEGLLRNIYNDDKEYVEHLNSHKKQFGKYWDWLPDEHDRMKNPKIHTIREDKKDRWKTGNKIDFFINCRQKDMFRFAPVMPVVGIQRVFMTYSYNDIIEISINGKQLHNQSEILEFVKNDGFDSWKDFFDYFHPQIMSSENEEYHGKIIHWTDLRY